MGRVLALLSVLLGVSAPAWALDFRSVAPPVAILYDAPSQAAKKLYLIREQTPVEVVVRLGNWVKVRDAEGTLAWIDAAALSEQRKLIVTARSAEIRQADSSSASVLMELAKWVVLDYLEPAAAGWVKVRHRDGVIGYLRTTQVWGL